MILKGVCMKIAVISDIHGNMEALTAVMEDIQLQNCDRLFVLGDYAMAGPEPKKSVEYFMNKSKDSNFEMIQGNTDLMIINYTEDLYNSLKDKAPVMAEALKDDALILNEQEKQFLKNLPAQKEIVIDGVKFLLVHGSPRRNNEDILPEMPLETIEEIIKETDADVILCGHTHLPCGYQTTKKQTVVNAGSIGRPFTQEPKSCYLTINVKNGNCVFEHHFVEYNKELASEKMQKRTFAGSEKLAAMLLYPTERHF